MEGGNGESGLLGFGPGSGDEGLGGGQVGTAGDAAEDQQSIAADLDVTGVLARGERGP